MKNQTKLKRVLITVKPDEAGYRFYSEVEDAVNSVLAPGYMSDMLSINEGEQSIRETSKDAVYGPVVASVKDVSWLPARSGNAPATFVLEAPAYLFKAGVPTYKGPIGKVHG